MNRSLALHGLGQLRFNCIIFLSNELCNESSITGRYKGIIEKIFQQQYSVNVSDHRSDVGLDYAY